MKCENCLYNKNCQFLLKHKNDNVEECTAFEDKSEWFHFPCKDCETAYYAIGYGSGAVVIEGPICGWGIKNGKRYVIDERGDLYEIGELVFLTKEEAEKDVERRKKSL